MPTPAEREEFEFRVAGPLAEANTVPVSVLVQVLDAAQKSFYLLALMQEGREVRERARVPAEVEQKYKLICGVPKPGSYCVPATLGDVESELFTPDPIRQVAERFRDVGEAITKHAFQKLNELIPSRQMRFKVLENMKLMMPTAGSGWNLAISRKAQQFARFDEDLVPLVQESLKRPEAVGMVQTITGKLSKIDFVKRVISIIYPVTSRELDCHYDESVEEVLLENRRDLIQVTGYVILDENDVPRSISEVVSINDLDLSPFRVSLIPYGSKSLRFRQQLTLQPASNESFQLLSLQHDDLGIDVYAPTRDGLLNELHDQIVMLWDEYALADYGTLSPKAAALKKTLLANIEEVGHATK